MIGILMTLFRMRVLAFIEYFESTIKVNKIKKVSGLFPDTLLLEYLFILIQTNDSTY